MPDSDKKIDIPHLDKLVHFTMYLFYTTAIIIETKNNKKSTILLIVLYSISFGAIMELLQHIFFDYRSGDIFDALFNAFGATCSLFIYKKIKELIKT